MAGRATTLMCILATGALGCGGSRARASPNALALAASPPGVADTASPGPSPETPNADVIETFRAYARLIDPNRMFMAVEQERPPGFRPIPAQRAGPFPGTVFSEVRAYSYRFGEGDKPCDLVARDGTMCPTVNAPGRSLSRDQQGRITSLVRDAVYWEKTGPNSRAGRAHMHCDFDPHLAFVWFDAAHRPVGYVEVCFDCGEWDATPYVDGIRGPSVMRSEEHDTIVALCNELTLDVCFFGESRRRDAFDSANNPPRPSGTPSPFDVWMSREPAVELDETLAATSIPERRTLCTWLAQRRSVEFGTYHGPDVTWTCTGGAPQTAQSFSDCVANFPNCDVSVREMVRCIEQSAICSDAGPCASRRECLWGVR